MNIKKSLGKEPIFFAYQGKQEGNNDNNVDSITHAIKIYNQHQKSYFAESWEDYKRTTIISKEILDAISRCAVFSCDLTYFNHNVLFELGFAIAKNRKILILLNEKVSGVKDKYRGFMLRDIRYTNFVNANDITTSLNNKAFQSGLLYKFVNIKNLKNEINAIFYIQSKVSTQASLELTAIINGYRGDLPYSVVSDNSSEVAYQPMTWYFQNLVKADIVLIHYLGSNLENADWENAKNSFYAGFACGLGKKVILVAPSKYKAPLDYHEILFQYDDPETLALTAIDWIKERLVQVDKIIPEKEVHELNLIKLGIGCEIAEQEENSLLNYFVPTSSYEAARNQQKCFLIGRKGSGKSAIKIKLLDDFRNNERIFLINLKPESDELLEEVEMAKLYKTQASKRSFFFTVWKFVVYSKLARLFSENIKGKSVYSDREKIEQELSEFVQQKEGLIKLNFYGVIREISKQVIDKKLSDTPEILEWFYKEYLSGLLRLLKDFIKVAKLEYYKIIILADNLDTTWDPKFNLDIQSEMILSLLDMDSKIKNDLHIDDCYKIDINEIIFLRKDIFDYILKASHEPDKLTSMMHEIEWEKYPGLLKMLIENRFRYILELKEDDDIEKKAWGEFFNLTSKEGKHPYEIINEVITHRPRDLIYFVSRLFESAINNNHKKVSSDDFQYAINNYTTFLNRNLIAETKAEFPEIESILSRLQKHQGEIMEFENFCIILKEFKYDVKKIDLLVETLFNKSYMIGFDEKNKQPILDLSMMKKALQKRRSFFFKQKVYVIAHAKYYFIKNKPETIF